MADDFNNTNTDSQGKNTDEVVDDIPKTAKDINSSAEEERKADTSSVSTGSASESIFLGAISLALGIFSIICCCFVVPPGISAFAGLVLGIIVLRGNYGGKNLAVVGIILSAIGIAIFIVAIASLILFGTVNSTFQVPATMHWGMM